MGFVLQPLSELRVEGKARTNSLEVERRLIRFRAAP
jgi:hypothetical protein